MYDVGYWPKLQYSNPIDRLSVSNFSHIDSLAAKVSSSSRRRKRRPTNMQSTCMVIKPSHAEKSIVTLKTN